MSSNLNKPLIGIIVGLEREKKLIDSKKNLIIESGYGTKAIEAAKKILKKKVDVIVSIGFAGSISKNIKNSEIIIPKIIFNKNKKGLKTSKKFNLYFKEILRNFKCFDDNLITSSHIENLNSFKRKKLTKVKNIVAVDMESYFVQVLAKKNNIDFCSIRVIFDDLDNSIPQFLLNIIDENGEIILKNLLISLFQKPKRIMSLIRLLQIYLKSRKKLKAIGLKLG